MTSHVGARDNVHAQPNANGGSRYHQARQSNTSSSSSDAHDGQDPRKDSFASHVFAPAINWYDEMQWSRRKQRLSKRQSLELFASYAPDWILTVVTAGLLQLINNVYGFRREFSLTDTSLQHTYTDHERISTGFLVVLAFIIPLVIIAVASLGLSRSVWDFHAGFLGLVVANALTLTATTIIKVSVGRPRPDFIDRCQPRQGAVNASLYELATEAVCTTDPSSQLISDGFRSFPSGHSSAGFAGLTFLTLWLAGKVHLWQRGRGSAASQWLLFLPMFGATMIAVSRTMDYRHHATDVIAGGILGFVIAVSTYFNYYPPLWHGDSQKPWSPRSTVVHRWTASGTSSPTRRYGSPSVLPTTYQDAQQDEGDSHFATRDTQQEWQYDKKPTSAPLQGFGSTETDRQPLRRNSHESEPTVDSLAIPLNSQDHA